MRTLRVLGGVAAALCGGLLFVEVLLQVTALFVRDRAEIWREGSSVRILCVGDSHTYGAGVPWDESYPAQLQRLLDQRAPGVYSVVNLGIPGMSTTQVRHRLPDEIRRYRPDMILVWCGINNQWNRAESENGSQGILGQLDGLASRSRLYRLVRVALHDRQLDHDRTIASDGQKWEIIGVDKPLTGNATYTVRRPDGMIERITHRKEGTKISGRAMAPVLEEDYGAMAAHAHAAGVRIAFMAYPLEVGATSVVNGALRRVAADRGVPLLETAASIERVPPTERNFLWAAHPNGRMYREIAKDLLPLVPVVAEGR
jgi:hypothetical protein